MKRLRAIVKELVACRKVCEDDLDMETLRRINLLQEGFLLIAQGLLDLPAKPRRTRRGNL